MATINMQIMRYINILDRASRVKTCKCFGYNNMIFFAVPKQKVSKAIGQDAINIRGMQEKIGKRVKIIREAEGISDASVFISDIVHPVKFKLLEIKDNMITITAGSNQNKAALIGRNKRRYEELRKIVHDTLAKDLKII